MDKITPVFSIDAVAVGGRNGHGETSDGLVHAEFSVPKEMGGAEGSAQAITPEHLFATGYAACFAGALDYVAKQHKINATDARVRCTVAIGSRDAGGFGLSVRMHIEHQTVPQMQLYDLVKEAHEKICPYSHATRNNVAVEFEVVGG